MLKPKEFVDNKSETLFGIALHFRTNIECSHRVRTSICRNSPRVDTEVRIRNFAKGRNIDIFGMPKLDNFLSHKAKMVIESPDISKTRSTF